MKKNKMMRLASCLLVAVMLTTSVISGTFAKYTTTTSSNDSARVARWGFDGTTITITDLFADAYDGTVDSNGNGDVIAPGTEGSTQIKFTTETNAAPEVDYTFEVTVASAASNDATNTILTNPNIKWAFYKTGETAVWGNFATMIAAIDAMDENVEANNLPTLSGEYTIAWQWIFDEAAGGVDYDTEDTAMGNAETLATVDLTVTITATQVD